MIDTHAADYCPTCGQPHETNSPIDRMGLTIRGHVLLYGEARQRLQPGVAKLTRALLEREQVSTAFLLLRVCPETTSNLLHVYICRFRKQLRELTHGAIVLGTIHSWGYELLHADAERIAA